LPSTPAYDQLLAELEKLPGIGRRSAQRIAFDLLRRPASDALNLAHALRAFREHLKVCGICGHVTESDPCPICADEKRDAATVLVVEQPNDVFAMEQTGVYQGRYHVLMGRLAPLEAIGPGDLNLKGLIDRIKQSQANDNDTVRIQEVILGTNPTLEGDGTALYLADQLAKAGVKVTRLARGMPTGSQMQGVSKAVLSDAVQGRVAMGEG